jgi:acyl dehydratase
MPSIHFEDLKPGAVDEYGAYEITRDAIIRFARQFDPQPFHLDEAAAKHTMLGGLSASGWHTASAAMRIAFDAYIHDSSSMGAPGVEELKWLKPVRPGDVLRARRRILGARASSSRPEMGLVHISNEILNQADDVVMTQEFFAMMGRRGYDGGEEPAARKPAPPPMKAATPDPAPQPQQLGFYEDLVVGRGIDLGSHTFSPEEIIAFARDFDPQPFHLSEEGAAKSHFGRLAASGWHTGSVWMRRFLDTRAAQQKAVLDAGGKLPQGGPSPGFRNLKWNKPVFAGDTISYRTVLADKRMTSKPGWGLIFSHNTGVNQHGERVFEFLGSAFVQTRGAA